MEALSAHLTAAKLLGLAALAALLTAAPAARADEADGAERTIRELAERVAVEQAENGPYSVELLPPLRSLGLLYDESGDYALSAAMIERAMQVVRANFGLRSFDQAPFLAQRIAAEEARGNFTGAWELEQSLLTLVAANPNDLRTVPVLRHIAAKRMDMAERYAAGEYPPQIHLGCYYNPSRNPQLGSCSSGSKGAAIGAIVADARRHYRNAIDVLVRQGLKSSDEVGDLERVIARDSYRHGAYGSGRQALTRLLNYGAQSSATLVSLADAALQVADWDLAFGQHPAALDIYSRIYSVLVRRSVEKAAIEQRFGSVTPILVPTFEANPFDPEQASDKADYIDVAFEITKYGRGRRPRILHATADTSENDRQELERLILSSRFRPRIVDGRFVDTQVVARRYLNAPSPFKPRHGTFARP